MRENPLRLYRRDRDILRSIVYGSQKLHAIICGHLILTVPAVAALLMTPYLGLRMLGPTLFVYYVFAGATLGWRWRSLALPGWRRWLVGNGIQAEDVEFLAQRTGLIWPGGGVICPFSLHTTAAVLCGLFLGPWALSRWFVWVLPLAGISVTTPRGDFYLQHLELITAVSALIGGFVICSYSPKLATCAWIVPTTIISYKLLTYTNPHASVLTSADFWSRFSYYFVIERFMPTFYNFRGSDPVRVAEQMQVVAPFYSGLAYSVRALMRKRDVLNKIRMRSHPETESEVFRAD